MNPYHLNRQLNKHKRQFMAKLSSFRPIPHTFFLLLSSFFSTPSTPFNRRTLSKLKRRGVSGIGDSIITFAKSRPKLALATAFILILTPTLIFILKNANQTEAGWFNDAWNYRQNLPINNSATALADYQIKLTLNTSTLITNKKLQASCADLRFTNFDGVELPYWIEASTCNTSSTYVWIKVDSIPAGGTTILMYYGNPTAAPASNIDNTFIFADDFNSPDSTKFDYATLGSSWYTFTGGTLRLISDATYRALKSFKTFNPSESYIIGTRMRFDTGSANWHHSYLIQNTDASRNRFGLQENAGTGAYRVQYRRDAEATWQYSANITTLSANTWYKSEIINQGTTTSTTLAAKFYSDAWSQLGSTVSVAATEWADETWAWNTWVNSATYHYLDWLIVRQYTPTEPTFGTAGSEEGGGGPIAHFTFDEAAGSTAFNKMETAPNPNAMMFHWKMDETSGTNVSDEMGRVNGTATGTTILDGKIGKARSFAGGTDAVSLGDPNILKQTGSQTISMWLYPTSIASNRQNPWCKSYGGEGCITQEMSGVLNYYYGTAGANSTPYTAIGSLVAVNQNAWNHVVIVRDLSKMTLTWYINGQQTNQIAAAYSAAVASTLSAYIGQGYTTNYVGRIDNVKVSSHPWTAAEVASEYVTMQAHAVGGIDYQEGATPPNNQKPLGTSAVFSGTNNQFLSLGDRPEFERTTFSISAWVYRLGNCGAYNSCTILAKGESGNVGYGFRIDSVSGTYVPRLDIRDSQQVLNGTTPINTDTWYHLVATADGTNYKLYVNGKLDSSAAISVTPTFGAEHVTIGNRNTNKDLPMNGRIDELKFFTYALTDEQIEIEYNRGAGTAFGVGDHPNDPSDNMIGWWKMDEDTTVVTDSYGNSLSPVLARDSSNYENHGTPTNGAYFSPGKFGNAAFFDGVDDSIAVETNSSILPVDEMSISAWVKTSDSNLFQHIAVQGNANGQKRWKFLIQNNTINFDVSINGNSHDGTASAPFVYTGQWAFVTATYQATGAQNIYVNGSLVYSGSGIGTLWSTCTESTTIGSRLNATGYFSGLIDDVRMFNTALTPAQISFLYSQGGPIIHYSFDEGFGTTANNQDQIAPITNLLGWWKFNDATSGTTPAPVDEMKTYSATFGGSAAYTTTAKLGNAVTLNGTNSFIDLPYNFGQTNTLTVSMWFRTSATSISALFGQANTQPTTAPTSWVPTILMNASGTLRAEIWTGAGGSIVSTTAYNDGNWHHLALTGDVTTQSLYVDGVLIGSRTGTISLTWWLYSTFGTGYIDTARGSAANAWYYFNGQIDDARIYNRSLSPGEVSILANSKQADAINGPTWTTGATPPGQKPMGTGLNLDGTNDYFVTPNSTALDLTNYTISGWLNIASLGDSIQHYVLSRYAWAANQGYGLSINNAGKILCDHNGSSGRLTTTNNHITAGTWYHVACTYDGTNLSAVLNGKVVESVTRSALSNYNSNLYVGTPADSPGNTNYTFSGFIDEVKLHNYALGESELLTEYNRGQAVALGVGQSPIAPSSSNLLGWWKFDDPSGSLVAQDSSGNNNTGTLTNGPSFIPGKFGNAAYFDGTDDKITTLSTSHSFNAGWHQGTVTTGSFSVWAKTNNFNANTLQPIISSSDGFSANTGISFEYDSRSGQNNRIAFKISKATSGTFRQLCYIENVLNDNNWHHWIAVVTETSISFYKDGIYLGAPTCSPSTATGTTTGNTTYPLSIAGNDESNFLFAGTIDNVKIYDSALTPAQIAYEYNQGKPVYHWSFDQDNGVIATNTEGTATSTDGLVGFWTMDSTTVNDMSGNGNNLTNSGSPTAATGIKGGAVDYLLSSSQYSYCTDANCGADLDYQGNGITASAWFYADSAITTTRSIINKSFWTNSTSNGGYSLAVNSSSNLQWCVSNSSGVSAYSCITSAVTNGNWYHASGTYDGQISRLFVNGIQVATANYSSGASNVSQSFYIGSGADATHWDGKIDHVKVWQRALSAPEVAREFQSSEKYGHLINFPTDNSQWTTGKYGNGLNFDGSNDYILAQSTDHIFSGTNPISFSSWFNIAAYPGASTYRVFFDRDVPDGGGRQGYSTWINGDGSSSLTLGFERFLNGSADSTNISILGKISLNQWHHVAFTYDGTYMKIYLDGTLQSTSASATKSLTTPLGNLKLGSRYGSSGFFYGKLDEMKIFSYALTADQILQEYQTGSAAVKL